MIDIPLTESGVSELRVQLKAVPRLFEQARDNLTEPARELAIIAIRAKEKKILMFEDLVDRLSRHHPALVPDAEQALAAVTEYRDWLDQAKDDMTYPAGVGKENYNWWMKNVWLYPRTWEESMNAERRDPMAQVAHNHTAHHLDYLRLRRDTRPIRSSYPRLFAACQMSGDYRMMRIP